MSLAAATEKSCVVCGGTYLPFTSMQKLCGKPRCAIKFGTGLSKQRRESTLREAKQTRERRAALKTIPDLIKEAQREFNSYCRQRDVGKPCISCGRPLGEGAVGGGYDCGHFRSTGSAPHLRFDERNAAGQCKHCNRYLSGNAVAYRQGLVARIGLEAVEALESDNAVRKWTREELIAIRDLYRKKRKELEAKE